MMLREGAAKRLCSFRARYRPSSSSFDEQFVTLSTTEPFTMVVCCVVNNARGINYKALPTSSTSSFETARCCMLSRSSNDVLYSPLGHLNCRWHEDDVSSLPCSQVAVSLVKKKKVFRNIPQFCWKPSLCADAARPRRIIIIFKKTKRGFWNVF